MNKEKEIIPEPDYSKITPPPPERKPIRIKVEREPEKTEIKISTIQGIRQGSGVVLAVPTKTGLGILQKLYKVQRIRPNGTVVLKPVKAPTAGGNKND